MRKLYKIQIETDDDNFYRLKPDQDSKNYGALELAFKANDVMLKNFLRRCRTADNTATPRSYRCITYREIITMIKNNCNELYIFSHMYPKTQQQLEELLR